MRTRPEPPACGRVQSLPHAAAQRLRHAAAQRRAVSPVGAGPDPGPPVPARTPARRDAARPALRQPIDVKIYADSPGKAARQVFTDLFVAAWLAFWIWLAVKLYDLVLKLQVPGQKLAGAGDGMAGGLSDAGGKVDKVPGVGGSLSSPFNSAADAARSMADAGRQEVQVAHDLAWALALLLLLGPVLVVLLVWLPMRVRWIRRA